MDPHDHDILSLAYGGAWYRPASMMGGQCWPARSPPPPATAALDPDVFDRRRLLPGAQQYHRRMMARAWIAGAMGVAIEHVAIVGDADRRYEEDQRKGVLVIIADPDTDTGRRWRFIPGFEGYGWLLLGACPVCRAPWVPLAYITNQRDLDSYLSRDRDDTVGTPLETDSDPAHYHTCPYGPQSNSSLGAAATEAPEHH